MSKSFVKCFLMCIYIDFDDWKNNEKIPSRTVITNGSTFYEFGIFWNQ